MVSTGDVLQELENFYGKQKPCWPTEPYLFLIWWHCGVSGIGRELWSWMGGTEQNGWGGVAADSGCFSQGSFGGIEGGRNGAGVEGDAPEGDSRAGAG